MIVGLKINSFERRKKEITLSVDNLEEVREHYATLYRENAKTRPINDPQMAHWRGVLNVLNHLISFTEMPVLSKKEEK